MGKNPDVSHMRMFGSRCWLAKHKDNIDGNFADKAVKGTFLGYCDSRKAYKIVTSDKKSVVRSLSVIFKEGDDTSMVEEREDITGERDEDEVSDAGDGEVTDTGNQGDKDSPK